MQEARKSHSLHVAPNGAPGSARGGGWGGLVRPRPLASFEPSQLRALAVQAHPIRAAAVSPLHSALRATVLRTRLLLRFTLYRSPPLLSAEREFLSPPPLYQEGGALPVCETSCFTLKLWCHSHQKQKAPYLCRVLFKQMASRRKILYLREVGVGTFDLLYLIGITQVYYITTRPVCQPLAHFFLPYLANKASLLPAAQLIGDIAPYKT